jgi:Fibronectin type III domain
LDKAVFCDYGCRLFHPQTVIIRRTNLNQTVRQLWLILTAGLLLLGGQASAQNGLTATVAWDVSPSTNVASYTVYYGTSTGYYTNSISVDASSTSLVIGGLNPGIVYFFAVTAVNDLNDESDFSTEAYFAIPAAPHLLAQTSRNSAGDLLLRITTLQVIPRYWEVQFSLDLVNWYSYGYGSDSSVDILSSIDPVTYPQLYFRLEMF